MTTRADRIHKILEMAGGRLAGYEIASQLAADEGVSGLVTSTVSATVAQDNKTRDASGRAPRFNTYGDGGEEWGFISIRKDAPVPEKDLRNFHGQIPQAIESANEETRKRLKAAIADLSWQQFEANFLTRILEALGFQGIELTQLTRDGGKDATCQYKRGIVSSEAIVSAKHWKSNSVAAIEVQRLRGIKGNADTGIIVTSSTFTADAKIEAAPSQNHRSIVLIDGELIVETCISTGIAIRPVNLPSLYEFVGFDDDPPRSGNK